MNYLSKLTNASDFIKIVSPIECQGKEHLQQFFEQIVAKGGEGVMLNEPNSFYEAKRSKNLRKFKPFFDTEVRVIKNQYPHGFACEQYLKTTNS